MPYKYKKKRQEYMRRYRTPYMRKYRQFKKWQLEEARKALESGKVELAKKILDMKPSISVSQKASTQKKESDKKHS